jgi:hypothetical protein
MNGEAADEAARVDADRQFHRYIVAKLTNKVLLRIAMALFDQRDTLWLGSSPPILTTPNLDSGFGRTPQDSVGAGGLIPSKPARCAII